MTTKIIRPSFPDIIFEIAHVWAKRSTCPRLPAGAVAVNQRFQILACGYNGAPRGMPHCIDVGCLMVDGHCVRTLHSEWNMIAQSAYNGGASLNGSSVYITARPCRICTMLMVQSGVKEIHYWKPYNTDGVKDQVEEIVRNFGIKIYGPYGV